MEARQKQCTQCGVVKSFDDFSKEARNKDGLRSECKQCNALKKRQYCKNNPIIAQTGHMISGARKRAKKKNLPFDIDQEYVRSL
ncbi:MAG: hypothetical protein EB101_11460, partial [Chitinophagia bacterium]|nr:hypothetical protein [Chitinophagia bacterium]